MGQNISDNKKNADLAYQKKVVYFEQCVFI